MRRKFGRIRFCKYFWFCYWGQPKKLVNSWPGHPWHLTVYSYRSCKWGSVPDYPPNLYGWCNAMEHANYAKKLCWKGRSYIVHITIYLTLKSSFLTVPSLISLRDRVRDLEVILNKNLRLTYHIKETCRKETNAIRSIGRIHKYLTNGNLNKFVNILLSTPHRAFQG